MKFLNKIYKTPLFGAIEKDNIEIVQLLLTNDKLDINFGYIFIQFFNRIQNYIFQFHSKSYISIKFKIIYFNLIQNYIFQWNSKLYISI